MNKEKQRQRQSVSASPTSHQHPVLLNMSQDDFTETKDAKETLRFRLEFEKLIAAISSRFVGLVDMDRAINTTLKDIGRFSGAGRAYLFLMREDGKTLDNTHEWCASGVMPQIDTLQNQPSDAAPWWMKKLHNNEIIHITDVSQMPAHAQAEREILARQDIKSLLVLPLHAGGKLRGFLGFDNVAETGSWSESDIQLLRLSSEIVGNALHRKHAEEENRRIQEFLQSIINSTSEIIIALDTSTKVTTWNKTTEFLTGYKTREIIGRPLLKLRVFDKPQELLAIIENIGKGKKKEMPEHLILRTKQGMKRIFRMWLSLIKSGTGETLGVLLFGRDITHEQCNANKLLRGNSYLISEKTNKVALELFLGLTQAHYNGLYITRANTEITKNKLFSSKNIRISLLSHEKKGGVDTISNLDALYTQIKEFSSRHANTVILLERIDYLITLFSFEQFVRELYTITDIVSKHNSILLVHLNPSFVDGRQYTILEEELCPVPSSEYDVIEIDDELHGILQFILENHQRHSIVSLKKISKAFSIDKSTTAKRVRLLENEGLITVKKQGREKTVRLSEKGDGLFKRIQRV